MEGRIRRKLLAYGLGFGALLLLAALTAVFLVDGRDRLGHETLWLLLAAGGLGFLYAKTLRRTVKPLEKLADAAERMAAGAEIDVPGEDRDDEIGQIAGSLVWLKHGNQARLDARSGESAQLRAVIETMADGVAVVGPDGRLKFANPAFTELASVRGELVGRRVDEILRAPAVLDAVDQVRAGAAPATVAHQEIGVTGRRIDVRVAGVETAGGPDRGVLVVFHDVTRVEALERVRREFVSNVSHELRTPLTSIKGAVETLLESDPADEPQLRLKLLAIAKRQAQRMEALVADLTDLSQIETGAIRLDRQELELSALLNDIAQQFTSQADERGVTIRVRAHPPLALWADRRRVEQVLVNLVDNGLKFNRPGGELLLEARRDPGGGTEVRVTDTGIGIPSDALENVFHRFFRVDGSRAGDVPGTGLGLSIVKHLMRLHGGSIELDSELGRGSVFTLRFPAATQAA